LSVLSVCLSCPVKLVYCSQTVGWIKMKPGMQVGLGPRHIVLDGDPPPSEKGAPPHCRLFGPCLLWPIGWMDQDANWYEGKPWLKQHCVWCGPNSTPKGQSPPIFGLYLLWPNSWMDQDATWYKFRPWSRPHCVTWGPCFPP